MTGKAGVDVTAIQTLHDFDRWKNEGISALRWDLLHSTDLDGVNNTQVASYSTGP